MFLYLYFLLLVGAIFGAVPDEPMPMLDGRIVGGSLLNITYAPYQVSLNNFITGHLCGGSIIGPKWILTAAHCTDRYKNQAVPLLRVKVGSSMKIASDGKIINVKRIIQHAKYAQARVDYDFSLIELFEDIEFDDTKKPVALPMQSESIADGTMCTVTGWGNTQNTQENDGWLRATQIPVFNQKKCKEAYKKSGVVTDRMICAGYPEGGKDACQGDSGGPLVSNGTLVGIVSWGHGCARPKYPGIYARVAYIRDWIKQNSGV